MRESALLNALVARLGAEKGQAIYDKITVIKDKEVKAPK